MQEINNIVVPVDLDRNTDKLVEFAINMANKLDAEISFIHAIEFHAMGEMGLGNPTYDDYNAQQFSHAKKVVEDIVQDATGKCKKCSGIAVIGDIVDEIVDHAQAQKADMLIIGTHGKRGLEKILLGSVAERVLKRSHCPVLVMNPYR